MSINPNPLASILSTTEQKKSSVKIITHACWSPFPYGRSASVVKHNSDWCFQLALQGCMHYCNFFLSSLHSAFPVNTCACSPHTPKQTRYLHFCVFINTSHSLQYKSCTVCCLQQSSYTELFALLCCIFIHISHQHQSSALTPPHLCSVSTVCSACRIRQDINMECTADAQQRILTN